MMNRCGEETAKLPHTFTAFDPLFGIFTWVSRWARLALGSGQVEPSIARHIMPQVNL